MTQTPDYTLRRSTLLFIAAGLGLAYAATAWLGGGQVVNEAVNVFLFAFAAGTAVAYWPDFIAAVRKRDLAPQDILAIGIFSAWSAVTIATIIAFSWRFAGKPPSWPDHPLWSARVLFSLLGAVCHMLAPHAIGGTLPRRQWVRFGALVTVAVLGVAATIVLL